MYPVDEQILWLEVSVKDVATVAESESFQQLVHERLQHTKKNTNSSVTHSGHNFKTESDMRGREGEGDRESNNLDDLRIQVAIAAVEIFLQILQDGEK